MDLLCDTSMAFGRDPNLNFEDEMKIMDSVAEVEEKHNDSSLNLSNTYRIFRWAKRVCYWDLFHKERLEFYSGNPGKALCAAYYSMVRLKQMEFRNEEEEEMERQRLVRLRNQMGELAWEKWEGARERNLRRE